jgi:hypothetical protein
MTYSDVLGTLNDFWTQFGGTSNRPDKHPGMKPFLADEGQAWG